MDYRARGKSKGCPSGSMLIELDWAEKMTKKKKNFSYRIINRCRIKDQVQDSSKIDLPSHLRVRQGIVSNVPCSISRLLKKLD